MPDQTPSMPPLPEPVAHMHSNGDFCQDVNVVSREWPVYLYTAEQVQAVADERVREALTGVAERKAELERKAALYDWLRENVHYMEAGNDYLNYHSGAIPASFDEDVRAFRAKAVSTLSLETSKGAGNG